VIKKRDFLLEQLDKEIRKISTSIYDPSISDEDYDKMLLEQKAYLEAKDFLDAFFKGTTESGHGLYYYSKDSDNAKAFSEMFATYISIRSFNSERVISALKGCLGDYTINIFEKLYQEINEYYLTKNKTTNK
jgi:hypothetical protein